MCNGNCRLHSPASPADSLAAYQAKLDEKERLYYESLQKTPPVPCAFKVGDIVTYTNEYGVPFEGREIAGFSTFEDMFNGRFIHLKKDAYWFPVKPSELKLSNTNVVQN